MRIAHVITRLILGGAQENTLLNCEDLLADYNDDVLLITGPALGPEGSLIERARSKRVPLEIISSLRRAIHPLRDAIAYRAIRSTLRQFQPDVVHTHSAKAGILGRAAAWSLGVPAIVHTVHGAPFYPYQSRAVRSFYRRCERWAARRCHALISVADAMTDLMVEARVAPAEKFTTIYSGMEVEPFLHADTLRDEARRELGYDDSHVVVGKIARLFPLKGHESLIRAASAVVEKHANTRFLLVGDGVLRDKLQRQIDAAGLGAYFQFAGLVSPERIPRLLAAMDIVAHTSLREGLARVLPQALIVGRPVISYDVDGAREVVIPDTPGLLLPPTSIGELTASLDRLIADRDLRERMGAAGRTRCADVFRHETMTAQIRALYESVLAKNADAAKPAARS